MGRQVRKVHPWYAHVNGHLLHNMHVARMYRWSSCKSYFFNQIIHIQLSQLVDHLKQEVELDIHLEFY